jgi:hypothetical protein
MNCSKRSPFILTMSLLCGLGILVANAQQKPESAEIKATPLSQPAKTGPARKLSPAQIQEILQQPSGFDKPVEAATFKEVLQLLSDRFDVPIRIDSPALARMVTDFKQNSLYERKVAIPVVRGLSVGGVLREALAQVGAREDELSPKLPLALRIRDGQILIVLSYISSNLLPPEKITEQLEGEPVTLLIEEKPFAEVLEDLRRITGANIVLDMRTKEKAKERVSVQLVDVRLYTALRVLGDMCELKPVDLNGVYYITSRENALRLQREIDREHFGEASDVQPDSMRQPGVTPKPEEPKKQ